MMTKDSPNVFGIYLRSSLIGSNPPAEAPIPTIGNSSSFLSVDSFGVASVLSTVTIHPV